MSEFKNLSSGWKVVRLDKVAPLQRGYDLPVDNIKEGLYPVVYSNGILKFHNEFKAKAPGVITGRSGTIGKVIYVEKDYWPHNTSLWVTNFCGNNPKFIYYMYINLNLIRFSAGSGVPTLNRNDIHLQKILLPPLDEQKKIAEILSTWDEAINLTINLIESKKQLKKALMQNLLTANIRFPQFKDEWEETKLGNIGVFKTSSVDKIIQKDECIVNLVNYMDVYRNTHINSNLKLSQTSASNREIENLSLAKGDVLFTPSSETPDDIGHSAVILSDMPNTLFSYHLVRFRLNIKNDIVFLGYVFNQDKILKQFARLSQGITRYTLSISDFQNVFINFPNLKEQQKIAEVLTACDDEINLLNLKLENLKKQKQGLMQKLLKGEIRTCYVKKAM